MKALPKRKGNYRVIAVKFTGGTASMKALPKRKGNLSERAGHHLVTVGLNESPSEKEGK